VALKDMPRKRRRLTPDEEAISPDSKPHRGTNLVRRAERLRRQNLKPTVPGSNELTS